MLNSCFSHAIAIAEGKFLSRLTPPSKKKSSSGDEIPVTALSSEEVSPGEVDPDIDDEDTEEEIDELAKEVDAAVTDLPDNSKQSKLAAKLLLKVRGFIAKVCHCLHFADWSINKLFKVRQSPQAKKYFKKCCETAKAELLELLPYCKTRWGSWNGVIGRLLVLKKVCFIYCDK